jgi:hypothetical protein
MHRGPIAHERDFDHTTDARMTSSRATSADRNDYTPEKNHKGIDWLSHMRATRFFS